MIVVFASLLLVLLLPFLLSLAGRAGMPKLLCLIFSLLALLLSVDKYAALLPWIAGMAIAVISVRERIQRRRVVRVLSFHGASQNERTRNVDIS
jgi:hypothetical protein